MDMMYEIMNDFQCTWSIAEYNCAMAILDFSEKSKEILSRSGYTDSDVRVARKHLMTAKISRENLVFKGLAGVPGAKHDASPKVIEVDLMLSDYEVISDLRILVQEAVNFVDLVLYPVDKFGQPFIKYMDKDYSNELFERWEVKYGCA